MIGIDTALRRMGYRPMPGTNHVWGKPVGFSLFVFDLQTLRWAQIYRLLSGEGVVTYKSVVMPKSTENWLDALADVETASGTIFHGPPFGFLSTEQAYEAIL